VAKKPQVDVENDAEADPEPTRLTPRQEKFIVEYFLQGGVKTRAAKKADVPYRTVLHWFENEEFKKRIAEIEGEWYDELTKEGIARAKAKSDVLLIFFLKARFPEMYDDNYRARRLKAEIIDDIRKELPQITIEGQEKLREPLK